METKPTEAILAGMVAAFAFFDCVPRRLARVLGKALEYDRDARYASARELAHDLTRVRLGMPVRARGPSWIRRLRMGWQDRS